MVNSEEADQVALAQLLDQLRSPAGDGSLFWFHPPNGGLRNKAEGGKLKAQGVKPGIPDVIIEEIPPNYPEKKGVRIELKRSNGKPSDVSKHQKAILERYELRGFLTFVCYGLDDAIKRIKDCGFC